MKKICTWLIVVYSLQLHAQILYDHGAIEPSQSSSSPSAFTRFGMKWNKTTISYYFVNGTDDIHGDIERIVVRQGMRLWERASTISFVEASSASSADIRIGWYTGDHGDGHPFDGMNNVPNVLAHAFSPSRGNGAFAGDVHFDDAERWSYYYQSNSNQPIDLVTVAAHEIGHALGIGHSQYANALMYGAYTGSHQYLHQDDIDAIRSLYGYPPPVLSSLDELSANSTATLRLSNVPSGVTVTWSSSSNVRIVSSSNSRATIRAVSSSTSGNGWVRVALSNGQTVTERFQILLPPRLSSLDHLCSSSRETLTLSNVPVGATVSWSSSSNVRIVSRSSSRAIIRAVSSTRAADG